LLLGLPSGDAPARRAIGRVGAPAFRRTHAHAYHALALDEQPSIWSLYRAEHLLIVLVYSFDAFRMDEKTTRPRIIGPNRGRVANLRLATHLLRSTDDFHGRKMSKSLQLRWIGISPHAVAEFDRQPDGRFPCERSGRESACVGETKTEIGLFWHRIVCLRIVSDGVKDPHGRISEITTSAPSYRATLRHTRRPDITNPCSSLLAKKLAVPIDGSATDNPSRFTASRECVICRISPPPPGKEPGHRSHAYTSPPDDTNIDRKSSTADSLRIHY